MAKKQKRITKPGKDEMNLAEFPLSVVGKRSPGKAKTLHFEDEVWDKSKKANVPRRLTITGSDLLGLPNSLDDEVLLGCVQLAKDAGFADRKLRFSRYELLELIRWNRDGKSYRRLNESLKRWAGTLVISDKAYWNKRTQSWVEDSFNIIDRNLLAEAGENSPKVKSALIWGDFMWQSFQAGNLKKLDFDFWLRLKSPVAKRIYRLLDKRFYYDSKVVKFDLKRLAFDKVGLSRNMHTGQIKQKLKPAHRELAELGKYHTEYQRKSRGHWQIEYQRIAQKSEPMSAPVTGLAQALQSRGITNPTRLVSKYPADRIEQCIENFDDRRGHGDDVKPGWLAKSITEGNFSFRAGYQPRTVVVKKRQLEQQSTIDEKKERESVVIRKKEAREDFERYWNSLAPEERVSKERIAIEEAKRAGDTMLAALVTGDDSTGALRRELWRKYILPRKEELSR